MNLICTRLLFKSIINANKSIINKNLKLYECLTTSCLATFKCSSLNYSLNLIQQKCKYTTTTTTTSNTTTSSTTKSKVLFRFFRNLI